MLILWVYKYLKSEVVYTPYIQGPNFTGQAKLTALNISLKMTYIGLPWWRSG